MLSPRILIGLGFGGLLLATACDEDKPKPKPKPKATVAPIATQTAKKPEEEKKEGKAPRPRKLDKELTADKRKKIETAHSDAKGFVVLSELEEQLKKKKPKAKDAALKAFDKIAKGKWILFVGPATNSKPEGFDMGVIYTPLMAGDPMGLSRQFFLVNFSDIKGYDEKRIPSGTMVAVLGKYAGKGKVESGYELVEEDNF